MKLPTVFSLALLAAGPVSAADPVSGPLEIDRPDIQPAGGGFKHHFQDPREGSRRPSLGGILRFNVPVRTEVVWKVGLSKRF